MLEKAIKEFFRELSSLRDFVEIVDSLLSAHHDETVTTEVHQNLSKMSVDTLNHLKNVFEMTSPSVTKVDAAIDPPSVPRASESDVPLAEDNAIREYHFKLKSQDEARAVLRFFDSVRRPTYEKMMLYRSALFNLTGAVEWYVSQLLRHYFATHPGSLGARDKFFSYHDLTSLGSIEEAKQALIDSKVEDLLRKGFGDWTDFFGQHLKLTMDYLTEDKPKLVEIYQRRNILMHNAGIVNHAYDSKVEKSLRDGIDVGTELQVTIEYINEAISLFEKNMILVGFELWRKLDSEDHQRGVVLDRIIYDLLLNHRWDVAESLSQFQSSDRALPDIYRMNARMNQFLCAKRQGRFSDVENGIKSMDLSGNHPLYRLIQFALLDDHDSFFELLPVVIMTDGIDTNSLAEWPILSEMRESDKFRHFCLENDLAQLIQGNTDASTNS